MSAYGHLAGDRIECFSLAVELKKEEVYDEYGAKHFRVGFKIGGGIDQDPLMAPFQYPDTGIYITHIEANSPAERAGLQQHDKVLRVNGIDFTMLTHHHAVKYIMKFEVLNMLIARSDIPPLR
ncbi:unnamed protein product [Auanema sp. JU1783]|nr:unnamed protein product [Auanema sp. JU1783]